MITSYNEQKKAIVDEYLKVGMEEQVLSIDSSQGREYDIVLLSTVRTTHGQFMSDYNRINVAITRAKHGLVIVGNSDVLMQDKKWASLLMTHRANVVDGISGALRWIAEQKKTYARDVIGLEE